LVSSACLKKIIDIASGHQRNIRVNDRGCHDIVVKVNFRKNIPERVVEVPASALVRDFRAHFLGFCKNSKIGAGDIDLIAPSRV
jgi:hypothetical protein